MLRACLCALCLLLGAMPVWADEKAAYDEAIHLASAGKAELAAAHLRAGLPLLDAENPWHARFEQAALLFEMQAAQSTQLMAGQGISSLLLARYVQEHAPPLAESPWLPAVIGAVFPGAGHAWLGRWHDAMVSALMVWPLLLLTFWAGIRKMGPVTVFFAMLTLWLWSGTVFSAWSLAERGDWEAYLLWWQGLWQASGLPGRPW